MVPHTTSPGEATGSRADAYVTELLPDDIDSTRVASFTGKRVKKNPSSLLGETVESLTVSVVGVVEQNGQVIVEVTYRGIRVDGSVKRVRTVFSRVLGDGITDLSPFHYNVDVRGDVTESGVVTSLPTIKTTELYGGVEGFGAVLLAEIIAYRMGSTEPDSRDRDYSSFSWYGSLHSAINDNRIHIDGWTLSWEHVVESIGPDSTTAASEAYIRTGYPESVRGKLSSDVPFSVEPPNKFDARKFNDYRAKRLYQRVKTASLSDAVSGVHVSSEFVQQQIKGYESLLQQYPDSVVAALENGDLGHAEQEIQAINQSFGDCVTVYGFYTFYRTIASIQGSTIAVNDVSSAIDEAVNAIVSGDQEKAETALHAASDSFVTVSTELSSTAQPELRELHGVLVYTGTLSQFEERMSNDTRLSRDTVEAYRSFVTDLIEISRKQSERGELARELYTLVFE